MDKITDTELDAYIESQRIDGDFMQVSMAEELKQLRQFSKQRWCSSELMECNAKVKKYEEALKEIIHDYNGYNMGYLKHHAVTMLRAAHKIAEEALK